MPGLRRIWLVVLLLTAFALPQGGSAQEIPPHAAIKPVPKEGNWMKRHESFNARAKQGDIDLIFLGDSITQGWEGAGKEAWQKHFADRKAANMGIGGDRTQHVLWRLDNGNIEGIKPRLVVLMIGTNNSNGTDHTAEEIADGIKAIVGKLRAKLPETKVLLLAVFPRGAMPNPQREKNAKASELASQMADGKMVHYLDIGPKFLQADGTLSREIMPDALHLSPKGYQIWADAIEPKVAELLGEKKRVAEN
jgi:beta-glucosidase